MAGDEEFDALYRYYPGVVSLLIRLGFPRDEARDLAQDVFVRVYQHMGEYRGEARWSYLERTARRLAFNAIRDKHAAKREGTVVSDELLTGLKDERQTPADRVVEEHAESERIHRAMEKLSPNDRTILMMHLAEHTYEEMAALLGISVSAVKSRLHTARSRLKDLL